MTPGIRNSVLASLTFIAGVLGMFVYSVVRTPVLDDAALAERGVIVLPTAREIAPFSLVDQDGVAFERSSLDGHWTFAFFGFTSCPDVCPLALAALSQVERRLVEEAEGTEAAGDRELLDRFQVVLVSVDPERDDQATLARYVSAFSPAFRGVRGSREDIAALAGQLNVAFMKVPDGRAGYSVDHTGNIVIINPRGHYQGLIKLPHDPDGILLAYRSLAARFGPG